MKALACRLMSAAATTAVILVSFWYQIGFGSLNTTYAPGFTEQRWRLVRPGMTRSEVEQLVGKPVPVWSDTYAGHESDSTVIRSLDVDLASGRVRAVGSYIHAWD